MIRSLGQISWPMWRAAEAIAALAARTGLRAQRALDCDDPEQIVLAAEASGLCAEDVSIGATELSRFLRTCGACLIAVTDEEGAPVLLCVLGAARGRVRLMTSFGPIVTQTCAEIEAALFERAAAPFAADVATIVEHVPAGRRERTRRAMLAGRIGNSPVARAWLLGPAQQDVRGLLRQLRFPQKVALFVAVQAMVFLLTVTGWIMLGRSTLGGRFDSAWVHGFWLALLTVIPGHMLSSWLEGRIAVDGSLAIKRRLLSSAMGLDPQALRKEGVGDLFAHVLEADTVEQLATSGGLQALQAIVELAATAMVLALGPARGWHFWLLFGWIAASALFIVYYAQCRRAWTKTRLRMTHDLVERLIGHRTRQAQEHADEGHHREDLLIEANLAAGRTMDRARALLEGLFPRMWLLLGLVVFGDWFLHAAADPAPLAIGLGALMLGFNAFRRLISSACDLAGAAVSLSGTKHLFAARTAIAEHPTRPHEPGPTIIEAHDLEIRHRDRAAPLLRGCSFEIRDGDRVLLQGPSGGGKSTLVSALLGMRRPSAGVLLANGLDHQTMGSAAWRTQVTAAPQFNENHLFSASLAFNLLCGRAWPPSDADLHRATALCRELGLGPLLERMPAGIQQMVGETGWQLSHGERSRVYIARALLQGSRCVIFDESFGTLDPESLAQSLDCVRRHANAAVVVAHP